jgi:putative transposase
MPFCRRYFHPGQLQFITTSTYRRTPIFSSDRFRRDFVQVLNQLRHEMQFLLVGWLLMPEHFHLLIKPEPADTTSLILQRLKDRTARRILAALRKHPENSWCRKMLARFRLPPSVHDESHCRVWQRRFYPFNVYSERKRLEKLDYMHHNPVKRGLVSSPDQWPWSSWRFYYVDDASILEMDRCP